jgi:hypothetical protein
MASTQHITHPLYDSYLHLSPHPTSTLIIPSSGVAVHQFSLLFHCLSIPVPGRLISGNCDILRDRSTHSTQSVHIRTRVSLHRCSLAKQHAVPSSRPRLHIFLLYAPRSVSVTMNMSDRESRCAVLFCFSIFLVFLHGYGARSLFFYLYVMLIWSNSGG